MSGVLIGSLGVAALLILVIGGVPVAISLLLVGFGTMWVLTDSFDIALTSLSSTSYQYLQQNVLGVIPLFILMGALMSSSRIGDYIFEAAQRALGKIAGGLGVASVGANTFFSTITGVSISSAAVFGRIAIPQMLERGYSKRLASGAVAGSSVLGEYSLL